MKKFLLALFGAAIVTGVALAQDAKPPLHLAMAGLAHDHAFGFLPRLLGQTDVQLVGIVETNQDLIARYSKRFHLAPELFYSSLEDLFAKTNVQAVAAFTSVYDHAGVVETCAEHGIDVMMEKPLAANLEQAHAIEAAAQKSGIQVIVNYETTWYSGNQAAYKMVHDENKIGDIREMVFHDGHSGPKEIGCSTNFLNWLTDPILNGGGAINDFGCYGADIATWFMDGQKPLSVTAVAQQIKPNVYPKVEDTATIILKYPRAQVILQPSWNWPFNIKDMQIFGKTGYVMVPRSDTLLVRTAGMETETESTAPGLSGLEADPIAYLAAVVRREIKPSGQSSLGVNVTVIEILDAAHRSVNEGKEIHL
jgi:predicted dehydrogenase